MRSYPRLAANCSNEEQTIVPDNPSLSIIIPVFNVEKYLSMCIDSLLRAEGIEETDIILVDDGSSDRSGEIADSYAAAHENIRSFHKENGGASSSRNLGIREAYGKYIFFCDSDDEVDPALFGDFIAKTKTSSADVFLWDCDIIYEEKSILSRKNTSYFSHCGLERTVKTYTGRQVVESLVKDGKGLIASVCLGAYRRDYLLDNGFFLEEGTTYEDELWIPQVFLNAKSVVYIPEKIYLYRIRHGSVTNPDNVDLEKNVKAMMYVYPKLYKYYEDTLADDPLRKYLEGNLTKRYLHMIYKYRFWRFDCGKNVDKALLRRTALKLRHKAMVLGLNLFIH